jgi:hypothetical protein
MCTLVDECGPKDLSTWGYFIYMGCMGWEGTRMGLRDDFCILYTMLYNGTPLCVYHTRLW